MIALFSDWFAAKETLIRPPNGSAMYSPPRGRRHWAADRRAARKRRRRNGK